MPRESLPGLPLRDGLVHKRAGSQEIGVEAIDRRNPASHIRVFTPNNPGTAMCRELRHDRKKREQTQS
jgi:hypothetical protein